MLLWLTLAYLTFLIFPLLCIFKNVKVIPQVYRILQHKEIRYACLSFYATVTFVPIPKRRQADELFGQNRPTGQGTERTPGDYRPLSTDFRHRKGRFALLARR